MADPKTYNEAQVRDRCNELFMESSQMILDMVRGTTTPFSCERIVALAGVGDTAAQMLDSVRSDSDDDDGEGPF